MAAINFFSEDIVFKIRHPRKVSTWIKESIERETKALRSINIIFCSDERLLSINKQFLNHHTLTDIITFDTRENNAELEGEIYISIDRVTENATKFGVLFEDELHRVIIHGILHLIGYTDKKSEAKLLMRKKEDTYLLLR
jgi:rRNA maturation RNase YbeY